jgi:hypothetical protein
MMRCERGVNVTHVSHKERLKTSISPTEAILAWVAVLLIGALVISLLVADSFAFPLPTLIPALALLTGALVISLLVVDSFAYPLPTLIPALAQVWAA